MKKPKRYFDLPDSDVIEKMVDGDWQRERSGVVKRTKEIYKLFGPPRGMMFSGINTADAYFEMINSYILGLYLSTIFSAHALLESTLSFGFAISSENKIAEGGLGTIANALLARKIISRKIFNRISELRAMRIAYFHSHVGLNKRGAMQRYVGKRARHSFEVHHSDAKTALRIVHEFLHETSPGFFKK